ncbi:MAG TPA: FixH family protein [Noviherbaspirillum sp.]|uniref:FixH family protein n=1 Tax=Noviherbaspirillum sp. TaxID=1926288 RepID=UPI002F956B01
MQNNTQALAPSHAASQTPRGPRTAPAPWYAHRWPWLLMLGPAAVVAAGIHTTFLAFSHQDALVVDDYYKQGKAINQDLRRDRAAASLGLSASLHYDASNGRLGGELRSGTRPLSGTFVLQLVHSTQPGKDIRLPVRADANGMFSASLPMLDIAKWQVIVEPDDREWRLAGAWQWPQDRTIRLDTAPGQ